MSLLSSSSGIISLLFLLLLSSSSSSLVSCSAISLPLLSHFTTSLPPLSSDPFRYLNQLATTSINRAHHLKHAKPATTINKTPLSSHSYGAYSVSLSFGTPPQTIPFVMDTGSDLVWFPCTRSYQCKNCDSTTHNLKLPTFIPKLSSSSRVLGCVNPKCAWIHDSDVQSRCTDCQSGFSNCTQICPPYLVVYGSGSTGGVLLSETLDLGKKSVPNFIAGCSVFSSHQPAGIAGFGRGLASLPSQMGLNKFSYCLISHRFDDTSKSSSMLLETGSRSGSKTDGVGYTPFVKNPIVADKHAFSVYYYVGLRKITVGGKHEKIPHKYLSTGADGGGGTIIDSGTTFTYLTGEVFNLVASEFIEQVKDYERVPEIERVTGLKPCFNISQHKTVKLPELKFQFKGGLEMVLPLPNYFMIPDDTGVACLSMVTDGVEGVDVSGGPSIILGNFQMQNYYVEYDLRNERLGFRQQKCS